ncbi:MAG: hypothetical protein Q7U94_06330 [Sideroxyarcus sp.]|nr:hypothetical protein [Sideroxyarcus sp.]
MSYLTQNAIERNALDNAECELDGVRSKFCHLVIDLAQVRFQRWSLIILVLSAFPSTTFALNFNPISIKGLAQAYGFVLGQEFTLSRINAEHPELSVSVELARAQFGSTFPDIKAKLEKQLRLSLGENLFQETATVLQSKIQETLARQRITKEVAANFLGQVKSRSKGEIESPVLEYLLAVNYMTNPVGEFTDGFRQRYHSDGTGKSQGIKLTLQVPRSWVAKEGERPHIVKKWQSENGTGLELIILDIRDGEGYNPSRQDMVNVISSGEIKSLVPSGSTYADSGNFNLEGQTGYWLQITTNIERAGTKLYQEATTYQLFFRGKAIGLHCQAGGPESEKSKTSEAFKRIKPLCQQVLNSLVLTQVY